VTEHFVLQGARSTTTTESAGRAALFLASVSSSLITLGFVAQDSATLGALLVSSCPPLLILGAFTFVRMTATSIEDLRYLAQIQQIRAYYRTLVPDGWDFFADAALFDDPMRQAMAFMGMHARRRNALFTAAGMVAAINSILAGAGTALVLTGPAALPIGVAVFIGVLVALGVYGLHAAWSGREYASGIKTLSPNHDPDTTS
jgi:hypothetical protein